MPRKLGKLASLLVLCVIFNPIGRAQSVDKKDSSKQGDLIATVAGQPLYEDDLLPAISSQMVPLRNQEYQIKKQALETLIDQKLLEAAAAKNGVSTDKFLEREVDAKIADPTDGEVYAFYLGQKNQLNRPFDDVKAQLKASLKQARIQQARQDLYKQLREQAKVAVLLEPPKAEVSYDLARLRGNPKAPVVIVEFADFQCPYCQQVEPTLKTILAKHEGQVAIAFRDLPLQQIHPQAEGAAEAARCAGEQGKFWEYHDALFNNPGKLDRSGLLDEAHSLKLDDKQFESCLTTEKYKVQIQADAQDGMRAGVNGTPGFFVNGVYMSGALPEATFEESIQGALLVAHTTPKSK